MNQFSSDPVEISVDQVPQYLRSGHFFKTLKENNDGHFSVPANVLKASPIINSVDDLRHSLRSLQYWIAWDPNYKETIIKYILICNFPQLVVELIQEFEIAFPFLQVIRLALEIEADDHESKFSPLPLVQYVLRKHPCAPAILTHLTDHESVQTKSSAEISTFLLKYNVESVAGEGHLELLKNLYVHKIRTTSLCYHAAKGGHLDCLEYLVSQNSHLREQTSHIAAANGHLHILKFLHLKRKPFDIYCCRQAALNGHLECVKYLCNIPLHLYTCLTAVAVGHKDCLKFALNNGAPAVGDLTLRNPNEEGEDEDDVVGEIVGKIGELGV